jgi:hypothetical protein
MYGVVKLSKHQVDLCKSLNWFSQLCMGRGAGPQVSLISTRPWMNCEIIIIVRFNSLFASSIILCYSVQHFIRLLLAIPISQ